MPIFNHGLPPRVNIMGEGGTDTSKDTVTPETLLEGVTAHNAAGEPIVGTCDYNANTENDTVTAEKMVQGTTAHDASGQPVTGTLDTEAIRAEGVEAGKKSEYDAFWDVYQKNGERINYLSAFAGVMWDTRTLRPKYDIVVKSAFEMFFHSGEESDFRISDLDEHLAMYGRRIDFSACGAYVNAFAYAHIKTLGTLNFSSCKGDSYFLSGAFQGSYVEKIGKILWSEETLTGNSTFQNSKLLSSLTIEGTIGQNGLNLSWSPLSKASIISVINALSDTTTGLTVTLRMSAIKTAFETSEGAADGNLSPEWQNLISTKPNWTINAIDS